jgi:acid phosphatase family membrane protein YuiD
VESSTFLESTVESQNSVHGTLKVRNKFGNARQFSVQKLCLCLALHKDIKSKYIIIIIIIIIIIVMNSEGLKQVPVP